MGRKSDYYFEMRYGKPVGNMEVIKYSYICQQERYTIETLSVQLYEPEYYNGGLYNSTIGWIRLDKVDKIDEVALNSPIYLTKRNDEAVFEHWRQLIIRNKNEYLEKIKKLDSYLESLES